MLLELHAHHMPLPDERHAVFTSYPGHADPREGELNVAICPSFRTLIVPSDVCRILSGSEILCQRTQDPTIRTVSEPQDFLLLKWIGPSQLIRCTMFNKFQIGIRHDTACYSSGSTMFHLKQPGKDSILEFVGMLRTTKL